MHKDASGDQSDTLPICNKNLSTNALLKSCNYSLKELLPEFERMSVQKLEKTSDKTLEACDFCKGRAKFMCDFCTFIYCPSCLKKVHPSIGPYLSHKVVPIDGQNKTRRYSLCGEHGLIAHLHCSYCDQNRCTECVKTKCNLHFKGRVSDADIEREKAILVDEFEVASTQLGFLERYKEKVQHEITHIQMTGLLRREQIKQEFVSFHDLLVQKEADMLEQLDQEVSERVHHVIDTLQGSVQSLEMEDAHLTTTVTDLVQSPSDAQFIEDYVKAKDLCHQIKDKVSDFNNEWAKNSIYIPCPVLDQHFAMLQEKHQLAEKLTGAMELPEIRFKQTTVFVDKEPIELSEFMELPRLPPSTEVIYCVQLFLRKKLVYEMQTSSVQDVKLNSLQTCILCPGLSYLLRITPTYKRFPTEVVSTNKYHRRGSPCHMFLVVKF